MPEQPRNMPEQERSIKARSHELFVDETPVVSNRSTKPFADFLRETPAEPLSVGLRALFWALGAVVAVLFLLAVWRVAHRQSGKPRTGEAPAKVVILRDAWRFPDDGSPRT